MMRDIYKRILMVCLVFMFITIPLKPIMVRAEANDNITADIKTEVAGDESSAEVTVYLKNTGNVPVKNVQIKNLLPDNIKTDDETEKIEDFLAPGSETAMKYVVRTEMVDNTQSGNDRTPDNTKKDTTKTVYSPTNSSDLQRSKKDDTATTKKVTNASTGDDTKTFLIIGIVLLSLFILIFSLKKGKEKEMLSLILCIIIGTSTIIPTSQVKATVPDTSIAIQKDIILSGDSYTITTNINYELPETIMPNGDTLTKAEWITELLDALDVSVQEVDYENVELPFNDISEHPSKNDILLAYANKLLPESEGKFDPDAPVNREYAAYTAVIGLGFVPVSDIICNDASSITYKQEIETAVAMDVFRLTDNLFRPNDFLTRAEADLALQRVKEIIFPEIPDGNSGQLLYDKNVVIIPEDAVYEVNEDVITFISGGENIKQNCIFILPDQTPYKASSIENNDSKIIVTTIEPSISETLNGIDVTGNATVDMDHFIPADGVSLVSNQSIATQEARTKIADVEGAITAPGKMTFNIHKDVGEGELTGEVSISLPKILYKADVELGWSGVNVRDVYLKIPKNIEVTGGYSLSHDAQKCSPFDGLIELGKFPITGVPGITVYVVAVAKYSIEGKFEAKLSVEGESGVQILSNRFRKIHNFTPNFEINALSGTFKGGVGIEGLLEICKRWNLIDLNVSMGPAVSAELTIRNPSLFCIDASIYLYGEFSALNESVVGDWLDIGYSLEFWDSHNSPIRKNLHFENLSRVDKCTFDSDTGKLLGMVANASDKKSPIEGAEIAAYQEGSTDAINSVQTDSNGNYSIDLPKGDYVIQISAPGYITFEYDVSIEKDKEKYCEIFLMIDSGQQGQIGSAFGNIKDAVAGTSIDNATISLYKGWNHATGDVVTTTQSDQNGDYFIQASVGNYTVTCEKAGYITNTKNIIVTTGTSEGQNITLNPIGEDLSDYPLRVILTWGEEPWDLDSHLLGPTVDNLNDYFHVYFGDKSYWNGSVKYADLDLDHTDSYGPETTTLYKKMDSGIYSFYVHDYTNQFDPNNTQLSASNAMVEVYLKGKFYALYPIPTGKQGTYWHVFDYDAKTKAVIPINTIGNTMTYNSKQENAIIQYSMEKPSALVTE